MSAASEYRIVFGEAVAEKLGNGFVFKRKPSFELRRETEYGVDRILLNGESRFSPRINISFDLCIDYYWRSHDIEKLFSKYPRLRFFENPRRVERIEYKGPWNWWIDVRSPPKTLIPRFCRAIRGTAYPFFARYSDIKKARRAVASSHFLWMVHDWRRLLVFDTALNDLAHFERLAMKKLSGEALREAMKDLARVQKGLAKIRTKTAASRPSD